MQLETHQSSIRSYRNIQTIVAYQVEATTIKSDRRVLSMFPLPLKGPDYFNTNRRHADSYNPYPDP
jgi:hypothetical protein